MSLCSAHKIFDPECKMCNSTPEDLFGRESWTLATKDAMEKGACTCKHCNFVFYKTTSRCPLCGTIWE